MIRQFTVSAVCALVVGAALLSTGDGSVYSNYVINETGPVIYWNSDETTGPTAGDSATLGGANNGTYIEAQAGGLTLGATGPRPAQGYRNMASANRAPEVTCGLTQYTELAGTAGVSTNSYSVQAWVNLASDYTSNRLNYITTRGNTDTSPWMNDGLHAGGSLAGYLQGGLNYYHSPLDPGETKVPGSRVLTPGSWYHVVTVRDGADVKVYLNGKQETETTWAYGTGNGETLNVGHRPDYSGGLADLGFRGRYDEVAVWDRSLSASEVNNLYVQAAGNHYSAAVLDDAPVAYWRLDETTGNNTARDETGHGHDFAYDAPSSRTGTGLDVGPRPYDYCGFDAVNNSPLLDKNDASADKLEFLGVADGLLPGSPGGINNDYSIEMWIRRDGPLGYADFSYLMNRNALGVDAGDFLGITSYGSADRNLLLYNGVWPASSTGYHTGTTPIEEDQWYHVGMIREGDHVSAYLNGMLEVEGTLVTKTGTDWSTGEWGFGNRMNAAASSSSFRFNGNMDEIAIYAGAVDPSMFLEHYLAATIPEPSSLMLSLMGLAGFALASRRRR